MCLFILMVVQFQLMINKPPRYYDSLYQNRANQRYPRVSFDNGNDQREEPPQDDIPEREPEQEEEPAPKEEGYVHTQEDELIESMTRYMNKMNGDD